MFIELTDHLRCPADHPESFLVLIPDEMSGREVRRGILGCPVCQREYPIREGVADFGGVGQEPPGGAYTPASVGPATLVAFLGIEGPGGYLGLVGDAGRFGGELARLLPGVHVAAVNPPTDQTPAPGVSRILAPRLPFKSRSFRGLVLGPPEAHGAEWQAAALGAVLPGLRAVGQGPVPDFPGFVLLASAEGWWVGRSEK